MEKQIDAKWTRTNASDASLTHITVDTSHLPQNYFFVFLFYLNTGPVVSVHTILLIGHFFLEGMYTSALSLSLSCLSRSLSLALSLSLSLSLSLRPRIR
jgi:hypothetical protein